MIGASPDLKRLHHVGYVVASIADVAEAFAASLEATWDGQITHDPLQKVRVTFLQTPGSTDAQIELIEPAAEDSPVSAFLKKAGGLHHLCYEVDDLDRVLANMKARGIMIAKRPHPAAAFGNRRIAWVCTRERLVLELLETAPPAKEAGSE